MNLQVQSLNSINGITGIAPAGESPRGVTVPVALFSGASGYDRENRKQSAGSQSDPDPSTLASESYTSSESPGSYHPEMPCFAQKASQLRPYRCALH